MRKSKAILFSTIFLLLLLGVLMLMNYRYPFLNSSVGPWSVGYNKSSEIFPNAFISSTNIITSEMVNRHLPEDIHYVADPFFLIDSTGQFIFVEIKGEGNADIAVFKLNSENRYDFGGIVLDEEFHLSYPQVFKHENEFYMIPEAKGSGHLLLYKSTNFPYNWKIEDTLLSNTHLKDATILLSKDLNLIVGVDDNLRQYMFTSDSLKGSWTEAKNYKQRWGNETRPGGRFFKVNNDWFLPLQNRSRGYGTGISIYRLERSNEYLELKLANRMYLGPQEQIKWFNRGMHHLDIQKIKGGYYMVYDGDRNTTGSQEFQFRRTIKFNIIDLYNFFKQL